MGTVGQSQDFPKRTTFGWHVNICIYVLSVYCKCTRKKKTIA